MAEGHLTEDQAREFWDARSHAAERWLSHPVLLVDEPDDVVEQFTWIEATAEITAENAAAKFREQLPDALGDDPREPLAVTGPRWHVPYHPEHDEGETPVPLDYETDDLYFIERTYWSEILLPADNAVPLWRIEWSAAE